MRKILLAGVLGLSLAANVVHAAADRGDAGDLNGIQTQITDVIRTMEKARAAGHYDKDGHGARAEALLWDAQAELKAAVASAKY